MCVRNSNIAGKTTLLSSRLEIIINGLFWRGQVSVIFTYFMFSQNFFDSFHNQTPNMNDGIKLDCLVDEIAACVYKEDRH